MANVLLIHSKRYHTDGVDIRYVLAINYPLRLSGLLANESLLTEQGDTLLSTSKELTKAKNQNRLDATATGVCI